jgi:cytochrome P450
MVVLKIALNQKSYRPLLIDIAGLPLNPFKALAHIHNNHGELSYANFFGKKLLFVSSPEIIEDIYSHEAKNQLSRDFMHDILYPVFLDGLINSKYDTWMKQRRLMQPLFNKDAVIIWQDMILAETHEVIRTLSDSQNQTLNLTDTIKTLVQSIFIKALFGQNDIQRDDKKLSQALNTALSALLPRAAMATLGRGWLSFLYSYQNRKYRAAMDDIKQYIYQEMERNQANGQQCILSFLMEAEDKKSGYRMSEDLLHDEMVDLYIAGQDTSVNILVWFFYLVGADEILQNKLCDEIDRYRNDTVNPETIAKHEYTKALLHETMRHYPAAPCLTRQTLETITIGGLTIDKGTTVVLNLFGVHHNKNYWPCPDQFNPDNFLNSTVATRPKYAFMPFGGGAHNCIGRHFAESEMMIIIISLYRTFRPENVNAIKTKAGVSLKADRDLIVKLNKRKKNNEHTTRV